MRRTDGGFEDKLATFPPPVLTGSGSTGSRTIPHLSPVARAPRGGAEAIAGNPELQEESTGLDLRV